MSGLEAIDGSPVLAIGRPTTGQAFPSGRLRWKRLHAVSVRGDAATNLGDPLSAYGVTGWGLSPRIRQHGDGATRRKGRQSLMNSHQQSWWPNVRTDRRMECRKMATDFETILVDVDGRGIATVTLNRPEVRNVIGKALIAEMRRAIAGLDADRGVRGVVLTGAGEVFCAGGDLRWMQDNMRQTRAEQIRESTSLADMLRELDQLSKPLIGRINGSAFGGGLGLVSVCDIAIGVVHAQFALTEVRLGLLPATISPFLVARIGASNTRRTMLNASSYDGAKAVEYGLLHACVPIAELDEAIEKEVTSLLRCAPGAVASSKALIAYVNGHGWRENRTYTAGSLADALGIAGRAGRHGMLLRKGYAFLGAQVAAERNTVNSRNVARFARPGAEAAQRAVGVSQVAGRSRNAVAASAVIGPAKLNFPLL